MSDQSPTNNSTSGDSERPQSIREVAEAAYEEVTSPDSEESPREGGVQRDERGRFAPKEARTGEAEDEAPPSPEVKAEAPEPPDPAKSNRPPDHWSAEDRAVFERLPPDAQAMLQRRYSEMEADYTRKSQANASAVQAVNQLAPIFSDPDIQRSLQEWQMHPIAAIQQWAGFHKRAVSPHVNDRAGLLIDLATQMGFDPAKLFATSQNRPPVALPPGVKDDPAVRYLADQYGKTANEIQAIRNEVQGIRQAEQQKFEQESLKVTRQGIDQFADMKGQDGKPLRPDFDEQLPFILELYKADPERDLAEAYETARRMNPKTWEQLVAAEKAKVHSQQSVAKAQAANRGNLRGMTAPVNKPTAKTGNGTLRDILEASADEVGF